MNSRPHRRPDAATVGAIPPPTPPPVLAADRFVDGLPLVGGQTRVSDRKRGVGIDSRVAAGQFGSELRGPGLSAVCWCGLVGDSGWAPSYSGRREDGDPPASPGASTVSLGRIAVHLGVPATSGPTEDQRNTSPPGPAFRPIAAGELRRRRIGGRWTPVGRVRVHDWDRGPTQQRFRFACSTIRMRTRRGCSGLPPRRCRRRGGHPAGPSTTRTEAPRPTRPFRDLVHPRLTSQFLFETLCARSVHREGRLGPAPGCQL